MKLKNPRAKGNRNRKKIIDYLESIGYSVAVVERTGRFIKIKDAWGIVDLIALRQDIVRNSKEEFGQLIFIQSKSNKSSSCKEYKNFVEMHSFPNFQVWTYIDRKGFIVKDAYGRKIYEIKLGDMK